MSGIVIQPLSPQDIEERLARDLPGWRLVDGELRRRFATHGWKSSLMDLLCVLLARSCLGASVT